MKRSLAGLFIVLIASNLASALGAPADILQHDPLAPASLPDLLAIPPSTSDLFAPGSLTDGAVGEPLLSGNLDDAAVPVTPATTPHATKLGAPPAGLFLMIQGIVCIAFFRGRRKWAALLVSALAVGKVGINSIPQLLVTRKAPEGAQLEPRELPVDGSVEASDAPRRDGTTRFAGLLRRMGLETGPPASRYLAVWSHKGDCVAGAGAVGFLSCPAAILGSSQCSLPDPEAVRALAPFDGVGLFAEPLITPLFARPPPAPATCA